MIMVVKIRLSQKNIKEIEQRDSDAVIISGDINIQGGNIAGRLSGDISTDAPPPPPK